MERTPEAVHYQASLSEYCWLLKTPCNAHPVLAAHDRVVHVVNQVCTFPQSWQLGKEVLEAIEAVHDISLVLRNYHFCGPAPDEGWEGLQLHVDTLDIIQRVLLTFGHLFRLSIEVETSFGLLYAERITDAVGEHRHGYAPEPSRHP